MYLLSLEELVEGAKSSRARPPTRLCQRGWRVGCVDARDGEVDEGGHAEGVDAHWAGEGDLDEPLLGHLAQVSVQLHITGTTRVHYWCIWVERMKGRMKQGSYDHKN